AQAEGSAQGEGGRCRSGQVQGRAIQVVLGCLSLPTKVGSEKLIQASIVRLEVFGEPKPGGPVHRGVGPAVEPRKVIRRQRRQSEEIGNLPARGRRIPIHVFRLEGKYLLGWKVPSPG